MNIEEARIDRDRLVGRLETLGQIGAIDGGGVSRQVSGTRRS